MIRKTTITASGAALLGATFLVVACSDSPEDDGGGDNGGGGTGPAMGGVSGTGQGGTGAGTGGSVTGGTPGTGGGVTGGTPGTGGSGGAATGGGGGAAAMGPYACAMNTPNCGQIGDFSTATAQSFGNSMFSGGVSVFGAGITRDMNDTTKLHITGMVTGYGHGFNIWLTACSTFEAYTGITFTISGTTGDTPMNTIDFQLQSNTDYPWQPRPMDNKGACTAPMGMDPYGVCIAPTLNVMLSPTATPMPQTVTWAMMMGGTPTAWSATDSPKEIVGIQWQFPWGSGKTMYAVDVTLDDVKFSGGTGPTTACPPYMGGGGGMGGAGGAGGGAGGAGGGAGGAGGGAAGGGAGGKAGGGGASGAAGQAGAGGMAAGAGGMAGRAGGGMGGT
jgi:hypothetical protein